MRRYLFIGDTHGDLAFAKLAIQRAHEEGAEAIQLGDWGYIWPGVTKIKELSEVLAARGVTMRFIDGNHDEHPRLRKLAGTRTATVLVPRLIYQSRGSVREDEDGTRFLFLGGAPSIDRSFRTDGRSWWPEEFITGEEFAQAMSAESPIHVLVTHDAPSFPPGFSAKGSPSYQEAQEASMQKIDTLIRHHKPTLHVHGHWHIRYERRHENGTRIIGLHCNGGDFNDAVLLWSRS